MIRGSIFNVMKISKGRKVNKGVNVLIIKFGENQWNPVRILKPTLEDMKYTLLFIFMCVVGMDAFSQKIPIDRHKYFVYLDKDGGQVHSKDGAAYVRVFMGIDSVKTIYEVRDYTLSGVLLSVAGSSSKEYLIHEGPAAWYNSQRKIIKKGYYTKGYPSGEWTEYYDNGKLKAIFNMLPYDEMVRSASRVPYSVINSWDSLGQAQVVNGNGEYLIRNDTTHLIMEKGVVKNGLREGNWEVFDRSGEIDCIDIYRNGQFVKGTRYHNRKAGEEYTALSVPPTYNGGEYALRKFLQKNVSYPPEAMYKKDSGTVFLRFVVDTAGSITQVAVISGVSKPLNEEAIRVAKLMPLWKPGMIRGRKEPIPFFLPIRFILQR